MCNIQRCVNVMYLFLDADPGFARRIVSMCILKPWTAEVGVVFATREGWPSTVSLLYS